MNFFNICFGKKATEKDIEYYESIKAELDHTIHIFQSDFIIYTKFADVFKYIEKLSQDKSLKFENKKLKDCLKKIEKNSEILEGFMSKRLKPNDDLSVIIDPTTNISSNSSYYVKIKDEDRNNMYQKLLNNLIDSYEKFIKVGEKEKARIGK